jgi:L-fuculose-phosphate aldolase
MAKVNVKKAIAECGKQIVDLGLVKATSGNISYRGTDSFFITPSGYPLNMLTAEEIVEVEATGQAIEVKEGVFGPLKPSMETGLHLAVYKAHPEAKAIVHAHPLYATLLGTIMEIRPVTYEAACFIYPINYVPPLLPGSKELATYVGNTKANVIVLKNHGVVVWGETLTECVFRMQVMEENAEQLYLAESLGYHPVVSEEDIFKLKIKE